MFIFENKIVSGSILSNKEWTLYEIKKKSSINGDSNNRIRDKIKNDSINYRDKIILDLQKSI